MAVILMTSAGCASEFEQQFAEAERLREEAAAAGFEWLETEKLLTEAREEAEQNNMETALQLVEKARFQAEAAIKQAQIEAEAWKSRVIK